MGEPTWSAGHIVAQLVERLLPCWFEHGVDRVHGGFHNRLADDLTPAADPDKRLLVQARQLFAFSIGVRLGAGSYAAEAAQRGYRFLTERMRDTRHGGWFLTATPSGEPLDRSKDLYAQAFVIFALAHYSRASGDAESLALAEETAALLTHHLADAAGGYLEGADEAWRPRKGARRQNPHMHLLEAELALAELASQTGALERARRLVALQGERFVDAEAGCLLERFDAHWRPLTGDSPWRR